MAFVDFLRTAAPAIGTLAGGPVGGAIGTLVSGAIGMGQSDNLRKQYDQKDAAIPSVDPATMAFRDQVAMRRRMYDAGTNRIAQNRMRLANQGMATTQANIARQTGGSAGGAIQGLLASQNVGQQNAMQALAPNDAASNQLLGMEQQLVDDMAQRRLSLQTYARDVAMSEYALSRQGAERNMMAAAGMMPQLRFGQKGGQQAADPGPMPSSFQVDPAQYRQTAFPTTTNPYQSMLLGQSQGPNYGLNYSF